MYQLKKSRYTGEVAFVVKVDSGTWIPCDPANTDYQEYLKWLEEGNTPEPAEEQQQGA